MSAPDPTPHADHDATSAGAPAAAATATAAPTAQGRSVTPDATGLRAAQDGRSSAGHSRTPHDQHIQGARPPRPRVIELSLLLLTAIALGCVGMAGALNGLWWLSSVAATVLTVLVVTGAARWLRVPSPLVTVLGLAALLLALTVVHLPSHALLGFIPTGETFTAAGELWRSSGDFISRDAAPYGPNPGLAFVLCTLVGLVTVFMETVLVGLRMAGLACLGVLALLVLPALTLPGSVTALGLAAAALAALALLAGSRFWGATRAQRIAPTPGGLPRALLVIAGVLAVVLFIPAVMPGFFNGAFPQGSSFTAERASGVGPLRAVGQDLRSDEHTRRFSYTTSDDQPQYMRLLTLSDFDQDEWFPDVENLDGDLSGLADAARNPVPRGTEVSAKVMFDDFSEHWLPAPYAPVAVSGLGDEGWAWNPRDLSIFSESTGMSGAEYTVTSVLSRATPEALRAAPSAASDPQLGDYLRLPANRPQSVADAARTFTEGADTDYDRALAIQNHLRDDFRYDVTAPLAQGYDAGGMGSLDEFMRTRTGYSGHFAPAMALMAREVGIPARVAVGYLPTAPVEDPDGGRSFPVSTGDSHAWPELYFEGVGWVRFEPTPGVPSTPDYAPDSAQDQGGEGSQTPEETAAPSNEPEQQPSEEPSDQPSDQPSEQPSEQPGDDPSQEPSPQDEAAPTTAAVPWWLVTGVLGLLALLALAAAPRVVRGRRRRARLAALQDASLTPQRRANAAWDEFRALAEDHGVTSPASDTPRVRARRLAAGLPGAQTAVDHLVADLESASYGAPDSRWTPRTTPEDLTLVRDEFRKRASRGGRLRADWWPASLWSGPRG